MKIFFLRIGILLAVLFAGYFIWSLTGRATEKESGWSKNPEFKVRFEYSEQGADSGKGNLIGIQPYLTAVNYSTAYNFETSLRFYFEQLKREGKLNSQSIVVLPEHIGTWLVLANEKQSVYKAASLHTAFNSMKAASVFSYLNGWFKSPVTDKNNYAILHLKAAKMARQYKQVFATLAKEYKCRIAAGSILLPDVAVDSSNTIQPKTGAVLYNTFFVFDTTGTIKATVHKQKVSSGDLFAPEATNTITLVATEEQSLSFATIKSTDYISKTDATKTYSVNKGSGFTKMQQGMSLTFNGSIFDKQLYGYLQLLQNDSLLVLTPSIGKGRIVCLWLK